MYPDAAKFWRMPLQFTEDLDILFLDVAATGEWAYILSLEVMPHTDETLEEFHTPHDVEFQDDADLEMVHPSELNKKRLSNIDSSSTKSKTKKKFIGAALLNKTLDRIVNVVESSSTTLTQTSLRYPSIAKCLVKLESIPGVSLDDELYIWAARLFLRDKHRKCFMILPTDEVRLRFLKLEIEMEKTTADDIPAAVAGGGAFLEEEKALKVVAVQEEPLVKLLDNDCGNGSGVGGGGGGEAFLEEEEKALKVVGFKKIGLDTWEFANEGFQGGKRHLLKTIKRRKRNPQNLQQEGTVKLCSDSPQLGVETEIEKLRNDWNKIKMEIQKLKKQQEITESCLVAVKEKIEKITKCRQQQIFAFVAKALDNPAMNKLINLRQKREIFNAQIAKKQRLASPQRSNKAMDSNEREQNEEELTIIESEVEKTLKRELCNGQIEKKQTLGSPQHENNLVEAMDNDREELAIIKSEEKTLFHASMDDEGSPSLVQKASNVVIPGSVSLDLNSKNYTFLQKLMEDEFEAQDEAELKQYHSKIVLEWENLIAKPPVEEVEVDRVESSKH
ncbi:Heat stress transcription factor A-2 [Camellia lanceoleosa]|uniref:Heat stress transcription factor A-2 n=1 Tax=Camellia lanceoleosa TaxID=1840588 RepID=A0ACC0FC47_9ERIC|nr:Heat stress transcription factor A-2 [Camellia lanceoleosa]